jgi:hypothetical protein
MSDSDCSILGRLIFVEGKGGINECIHTVKDTSVREHRA